LNRTDTAEQWKTLQAAEDAVSAQLASVAKRIGQTKVAAPVSGIVLPATSSIRSLDSSTSLSLRDRVGTSADDYRAWCRISPDGAVNAVLVIDARDRTNIDVGAAVNISLTESPEIVFSSTITSVSAIENDQPSVTRQAAYQVLCPLPEVDQQKMLRWLGKECKGVFHLPHRTLASDMTQWMSEWLGGR
jgi:putative peptide zinc metalloprotease protein